MCGDWRERNSRVAFVGIVIVCNFSTTPKLAVKSFEFSYQNIIKIFRFPRCLHWLLECLWKTISIGNETSQHEITSATKCGIYLAPILSRCRSKFLAHKRENQNKSLDASAAENLCKQFPRWRFTIDTMEFVLAVMVLCGLRKYSRKTFVTCSCTSIQHVTFAMEH